MEYITPQEASIKWEISLRRVQSFCANKKIPGAVRRGRQWFIPENASRPIDGRTKTAKSARIEGAYHFPGFLLSRFFSARSELSEEENALLDAQILTAQSELLDSSKQCRKLIDKTSSTSVTFGAYATLAFDSLVLGQHSDLISCENEMKKICEASTEHKEDYRLVLGWLKLNYSFDSSDLKSIRASKLSTDALIFFEICSLIAGIFCNASESPWALKTYDVFCRQLESYGILPALMLAHAVQGSHYSRVGDREVQRKHIKLFCRIGYEQHYYLLLSKFGVFGPDIFQEELSQYGSQVTKKVAKIRQHNQSNWMVVYSTIQGKKLPFNLTESAEQNEILLLLTYGMSNQEIADCKGVSKSKINTLIKEMCKQNHCASKAELTSFAERIFTPTP